MPIKHLNLPTHVEDGKSFQIFISEASINSTLKAYFENNLLWIDYEVSPSFVKSLFKKFEDVFGDDFTKVKVKFLAEHSQPKMKISNGKMFVNSDTKIEIMNPLNPSI